MVYINMFVTK